MPGINPTPRSALHQLGDDLSPAQARLLGLLLQQAAPISTIDVRTTVSVGNVSGTAIELSARLAPLGWSVRCELRRHRNKFGGHGLLGWWILEPVPEPSTPARRQPEGASA